MKISDHYLGYQKKTLIVVTNSEKARIFGAEDKEVEEIDILEVETETPEERAGGVANAAPPDIDQIKQHSKLELYRNLSDRLQEWLQKGYESITLCVPEAFKNEIEEQMHADVKKVLNEIVPKNLASLELDQIIRILQEKKPE